VAGMNDPLRPGSGFAELVGYELLQWREDYAEIALTVEARHLNRSGILHGGLLATLVDTACGYAGAYCAEPGRVRRAVTLALDTHFIGAVEAGSRLIATGRRTGGGRRTFFSTAEVRDQEGRLVGQGSCVHQYRRGSEDPRGVPEN